MTEPARRSRTLGWFLLAAAVLSLAIGAFLTFRTPGGSFASECGRSSLSLYREPAVEGRAEVGIDYARLCNADARRGVNGGIFYLVGATVGMTVASYRLRPAGAARFTRPVVGSLAMVGIALAYAAAVIAT